MDLNNSKTKSKQSSCRGITNCVINLPRTFITSTQGALLLNAVLENVMLFSGQMPLAFALFKENVKRAMNNQENQSGNQNWGSQLQSRQLEAAKQTVDQILTIKENVIQEFKKTEITEAVIGLGSTIFSLKHAIVIRLPAVDRNHYCSNHERENISLVMNFSRQMAVSQEMSMDIDGKTPKVFLLLRKAGVASANEFFRPMPGFQLSKNCKTICLQVLLENEGNNESNCCNLMKICSDVSNMSLDYGRELQGVGNKDGSYNWFISSVPIIGLKKKF